MIPKLKRQLEKRKAQTQERIDPVNWPGQSPMIDPPAIKYELPQKQQAISAGGIGVVLEAIKTLGVRKAINEHLTLLKLHLPYYEADHVLTLSCSPLMAQHCVEPAGGWDLSGQAKLFDDEPYFFYITNVPKSKQSARQIVAQANQRCGQENLISQLKASGAFTAPLDNLHSNWAYMVIASLAWSLKVWCGLLVRTDETAESDDEQTQSLKACKREILRMEFNTFRHRLLNIPSQIIKQARGLTYRLLSDRESVEVLFLLHDHIRQPLRC